VRPLADAKGLRLRIGAVFGVVQTDAGLLRSVVQNLLTNAIRYTERGGVLIGVRRCGDRMRIDVVDTGVGIPEDQHRAIFGEFTRLGAVEAEGLGLGLAMVERIARLLDLDITVTSHPGRGSRFAVTIAASAEPAITVVPAATRVATHLAERPVTVLVVDNDPTIIEASTALFAGHGHRVLGARTIAEALALVDRADAALIDYDLDRGENGLVLIDRIQRSAPHVALAMITATQDRVLLTDLRKRGVPFFAKPVDPDDLARFLAEVSKREVESQ
jgi:CheY-like chemotaxis protein/anti-sigma regulatory factor (Ser/Thr protein kinase)